MKYENSKLESSRYKQTKIFSSVPNSLANTNPIQFKAILNKKLSLILSKQTIKLNNISSPLKSFKTS